MQDAPAKGSAAAPYDLSTKGGAVLRSTANSYLISSPGYYKIPLVYGNAITGGATNTSAYISTAPATNYNGYDMILHHFKDHAGQDITDPWITQSNGGANVPDGAKLVWSDVSGVVEVSSVSLTPDGKYLQFHVPQDKIKNGNAVVAAVKGGVAVWSWHLWFAHDDELSTVAIENYQGHTYNFTKQSLGFFFLKWKGTTYNKPRVARVKIEQTTGNGGSRAFAYVDITQRPGDERDSRTTLYQFGRKDALPGTASVADGTFNYSPSTSDFKDLIQHPENLYFNGGVFGDYVSPTKYSYYNLWSANNTELTYNDNAVVKTVYDPCPAGFKMPPSNAITFWSTDGTSGGQLNVEGDPNMDWYSGYWFKSHSGTNTVFFPMTGWYSYAGAPDTWGGSLCEYWMATPYRYDQGIAPYFTQNSNPVIQYSCSRPCGFGVRPIAE